MNELAAKLHMDPFEIREKNIVREGDVMPAYYGQVNTSCALDRCLTCVKEMIGWEEKYPVRDMGNGKVRAVGMGMAMQAPELPPSMWEVRRLRSMMTDFTRFPSALRYGNGLRYDPCTDRGRGAGVFSGGDHCSWCRHGFLSV